MLISSPLLMHLVQFKHMADVKLAQIAAQSTKSSDGSLSPYEFFYVWINYHWYSFFFIRFVSRVNSLMCGYITSFSKSFISHISFIRFVSRVNSLMCA
ncbi:hypothetical protein evm_009231 [Chilo suppressalis]|nr:hypothetical protein evm_009231 [Chilo suppressalis]